MTRVRSRSHGPNNSPATAESPSASIWWRGGGLVAGLLAYLAVFLSQPIAELGPDPRTGQPFTRLAHQFLLWLTPDEWILHAFGGGVRPIGLLDRVPVLLGATAILAGGFLLGRVLLAWWRADRWLDPLETLVFSTAAGLHLLSLLTLVLGLSGGLHLKWLSWLGAGLIVVFYLGWRSRGSAARSSSAAGEAHSATTEPAEPLHYVGAALAVAFVVLYLLGGMLPPWEFDVREYHLQVPKEWYFAGQIGFLAHNVYGNMPLGAEMHALLGMLIMPGEDSWWWGALVGKTVISSFVPLTSLALYTAGRRWFNRTAGLLAALVYLSIPWMAHVSLAGLVEGVVGCYLFLAVYAVLIAAGRWLQKDSNRSHPIAPGLLLLAGWMAGSAAACKYPAVLFVVVPIVLSVAVLSRGSWRAVVIVGLAAAAAGGPWYLKNAVLIGNPVYPLAAQYLDGKTRTPERIEQWNRAHEVPREQGSSYSVSQLARAAMQVAWKSPWQSSLVVPLSIAALVLVRSQRRLLLVLALGSLYILACWWLFTHRIDRFWVVLLPLPALLAGSLASSRLPNWGRWFLIGYVLLGLFLSFVVIGSGALADTRFFVALEDLRYDIPRSETDASRVPAAIRFVNETLRETNRSVDMPGNEPNEAGNRLLLVGEAQAFDFEVPVLYSTCFDENPLEAVLQLDSPARQRQQLDELELSQVLIHWGEIERYRRTYGFSELITREQVDRLVARGLLRPLQVPDDVAHRGVELYRVIGQAAESAASELP